VQLRLVTGEQCRLSMQLINDHAEFVHSRRGPRRHQMRLTRVFEQYQTDARQECV
jgi:hypothetical protein